MTALSNTTAFVTGSNRGIGRALAQELLTQGVAKLYAAARDTSSLSDLVAAHPGRVIAVKLDVTNSKDIAQAAALAADVNLLINNAGVAGFTSTMSQDATEQARFEMDVNYFAPLAVTRAFAPVLGANGGGGVVTISSIAALSNFPVLATYSASKAAIHSLMQAFRAELAGQGTYVGTVYPGPVDTDLAAKFVSDKASASAVAQAILEGVAAKQHEIFPDAMSQTLVAVHNKDRHELDAMTATYLPAA
ncbi:MAG: SDR family oxidoreductase [Pelagimonas sp.]|uniref:SDR family oxidoreductase n=1 Tax=Pelagimonas sp. TaxID=2073170 RepID=UPI003D6C2826